MVHIFQRRLSRRVRLYISHIAHMPFGCIRSCMRFVGRIKMSASRTRIGCAAIAKLMDMKTMIARSQAGDFRPNLYPIGHFGESNGAARLCCPRWDEAPRQLSGVPTVFRQAFGTAR